MSFPVAGTLMVEPTESEDLGEIDRFCDAMIAIKAEIDRVGAGEWSAEDSPLRNAPHTARALRRRSGSGPTTRELGVFPAGLDPDKYWPPVARIDQAYGDRNLVCSCPPPRRSPSDPILRRAAGQRLQGHGRLPSVVAGVLTAGTADRGSAARATCRATAGATRSTGSARSPRPSSPSP